MLSVTLRQRWIITSCYHTEAESYGFKFTRTHTTSSDLMSQLRSNPSKLLTPTGISAVGFLHHCLEASK